MKLGLLTAAFPTLTLDEIADWASANGFETLEVACWPAGEGAARRYAGVCHIDVDTLDDARAREITDGLARRGLAISALAYYPNPLSGDADARAASHEHLRKVIAAAPKLGVDIVGTFVGRDRTKNLPDSQADFRDVWPPLVAHAAEHGVRIALEMHPGFVVYNPETLLRLRAAAGPAVGANYDPSHLFWQGIDAVEAIRTLGDQGAMFHVHAKDTFIDPVNARVNGVLDTKSYGRIPERSWIFRTVGFGQPEKVWRDIVSALRTVDYDYVMSIEHEDALMSIDEGLRKAVDFLDPLIVKEEAGTPWWA